ncbi:MULTISPECIES: alpha/beta fold hydrolase [Okeania]|uniref:Alpha/beta hydrolase n=2 Tax=Okeania TaxID=1458928 RepID=A0A3N6PZB4_9CYAN|nr:MULTISPECIES: alpha/beta hydrolase [Okeania]NET12721.1 alpha/beta hydrolase [Okeania sp. SIO1H6]NES76842.1 alpha/beta hydrolase [Okeania sp. SIO1H4]NET20471.1 alpha/beta hydrolase [Okeania sp. SIO1H5]NET78244.1 alpha/beta hydrolase [Okeania sp. SIO1F9]NET94621.1 alpha/beta hydrolase [Okeania sp. SIO1H2]
MVSSLPLHFQLKGEGFPILCLHGHPGSGQCMSVFTNSLCQNFQTIAPDLRGYGKSYTKKDFEITQHLVDLEILLDQLQIPKYFILGWSLGGIIAMELALKNPEKVAGLILIGTAARPRGNHPPITWQDNLYTGLAGIINWLMPGWQWNIDTFGKRSLFRYLIQQHTPASYKYLAKEAVSAYLQTSKFATRALNQALRSDYNRLSALPQIQCPCLVLAGASDCHITPESSQETALHLNHAHWQCYPNTAHLFPWEISQQVLTDIKKWIQLQQK